jgi:rhamnulokinase
MSTHLAIDLGAESGRVMIGRVGETIALEELHRWPSRRVRIAGGERWDVLFMWAQILQGLRLAAEREPDIGSLSVDTWGVDYVHLLDGQPYLTPPFMYRDPRTTAVYQATLADEERRRMVFDRTGIQFLPFNTIYQLASDDPAVTERSDGWLLMSDYFHFLLSGLRRQERSQASTTQLYDPAARDWSRPLIDAFGLRYDLFPDLVDSGTSLGPITDEVARLTGLPTDVKVVATCSHDTGNAVAATPLDQSGAYLSSGTWSLLGVESPEPVITDAARGHNFTNEVGHGHTIRLLKNLSGLFLVQECRRDFAGEPDYAELADAAASVEAGRSLVRPEAAPFMEPGEMCRKIADFCRDTGQLVPKTPGEFVRCCYESLALLYAETLDALGEITGRRPTSLHVVGGGSNASLLNQLAADACGVPVHAGPAEATALGNIGIQAMAAGAVADLNDLRRRVRASTTIRTFTPAGDLAAHADRFARLRS